MKIWWSQATRCCILVRQMLGIDSKGYAQQFSQEYSSHLMLLWPSCFDRWGWWCWYHHYKIIWTWKTFLLSCSFRKKIAIAAFYWGLEFSSNKIELRNRVTKSIIFIEIFLSSYCNHSQNISDKLSFSCEIAHYEKSQISIFQEIFASTDKTFISGGGLSTRQ